MTSLTARTFCRICDRPRPDAEYHTEAIHWRAEPCYAGHNCAFTCSLDEGHDGPHEAMTDSVRVVARWNR